MLWSSIAAWAKSTSPTRPPLSDSFRSSRLKISKEKFTDAPLEEFDYTKPHGPLYYDADSKQWFHNNTVTSEYMILKDLPLVQCERVQLVKHHHAYCNKFKSGCADLARTEADAGADLIPKLIGMGRTEVGKLFECKDPRGRIDYSVDAAISTLFRRIVGKFDATRAGTLPTADHVEMMKAILLASGYNRRPRVAALLGTFPNKEAVETAFFSCLDEFFTGLKVSRE